MEAKDMWLASGQPAETYEAWAFGGDNPDYLADLVLKGVKTATASVYPLYALEGEPLPQAGDYSVILNAKKEAVCIIRNTKVSLIPYKEISEELAAKEGEGDKSLAYWQSAHEPLFREWLSQAGLDFTEDMLVVFEEFSLVYAPE